MMPWYIKYIKSGALALNRGAQVTGDMGAMLMVDGHKGYGSEAHREAIASLGPTPIHRLSFRLTDDAGS
jgi:LDH2 family malate/lactate/ureidoglycolate dehydrogenase